jgi:hypothetical protein
LEVKFEKEFEVSYNLRQYLPLKIYPQYKINKSLYENPIHVKYIYPNLNMEEKHAFVGHNNI